MSKSTHAVFDVAIAALKHGTNANAADVRDRPPLTRAAARGHAQCLPVPPSAATAWRQH